MAPSSLRVSVSPWSKLFSVAALILVTGCKVDHKRETDKYRAVLDERAPHVDSLKPAEELTLERAMLLANQSNEQLASKGEDYLQAIIDKNRAYANFLPTISLAPTYSLSHSSNSGGSFLLTGLGNTGGTGSSAGGLAVSTGSRSKITHQLSVPVSGQMNVFNGFRDVAELDRTKISIEQQKALLLDQQMSLFLNVAQTFYQVLKAERSTQVLQNSLTLQQERIRDQEARLKLGASRPLDVAQTRSDEASTRVSLRQAQADARNARTTLAYLIGEPSVAGPMRDTYRPPTTLPSSGEWEKQALTKRKDLAADREAIAAAEQNVRSAVGKFYPSVSLDLNYFLFHDPPSGGLWTFGLSGNLPLFTGGVIWNDVRTAWSQYRQAGLAESQLRRQIIQDVATAYENLLNSTDKLEELKSEVSASQQAYDLAERSYKLGAASNLDRLSAQDKLLNAQLQLASEEYTEKTAYLNLLRVCGALTAQSAAEATPGR